MKVLLVNGSPHEFGSTNRALEEVKSSLSKNGIETEVFWIGNDAIRGCLGCGSCIKSNLWIGVFMLKQISLSISQLQRLYQQDAVGVLVLLMI